jgi:hydrogenase maturation protein HypF
MTHPAPNVISNPASTPEAFGPNGYLGMPNTESSWSAGIDKRERRTMRVTGVVQGVGFRPFVHRLAIEVGLTGHVGNDTTGVFLAVEGPASVIDRFTARLWAEAPPLAQIEHVTTEAVEPVGEQGFVIVDSVTATGGVTLVPPDGAVCDDCLREMRDPADRRFGHPFITCTNCGPRFTIIQAMPYDRPNTTMASFPMCDVCQAEYDNPADRRHHAQPIGCHQCGPTASFSSEGDPIQSAAVALREGMILAVKSVGGYHLCCDATSDETVGELRRRKGRGDKPFAVMVADLEAARSIAFVDEEEAVQLQLAARPIVLLRARTDSPVSRLVAPGNPLIGVMLPSMALQHLLVEQAGLPLVMTSGNRSGEPIAYRDDDARNRLGDLVDGFLTHNRDIHVPCDDSVVRLVDGELQPIRRSRGFAPLPVRLPDNGREVLAVGGELKNTFCVASGEHAWVSQHLGDMENLDTIEAFESSVAHFLQMYRVEPEMLVADAHPGYLTSKWADARGGAVLKVQHHHAHVAAVMAEHQLAPHTDVIGVAFDGTGYGPDAAIWGGEFMVANATRFERVAHLKYVPLPGGDTAVRNPCRVALAHLWAAGIQWTADLAPYNQLSEIERGLLLRQLERGLNCVPTSSIGRLFDAVSSLLGLRHQISYEAQAAIELEVAAEPFLHDHPSYTFACEGIGIEAAPVWSGMVSDLRTGVPVGAIAAGFHLAVATMVIDVAVRTRRSTGLNTVALSGGVFQNAVLTTLVKHLLTAEGFDVRTHRLVPPNDGGLALGQAYIGTYGLHEGKDD